VLSEFNREYLRSTAEQHRVSGDLFQLSTFPIPRSARPADRSRAGSAGRLHGLALGANSAAMSWRQASGPSDDRLGPAPAK